MKINFQERTEILKGKIFKMSPVRSRKHQEISFQSSLIFRNFFKQTACNVWLFSLHTGNAIVLKTIFEWYLLDFIPIKKVKLLSPFLPQIYHKLNLLILWSFKDIMAMDF